MTEYTLLISPKMVINIIIFNNLNYFFNKESKNANGGVW